MHSYLKFAAAFSFTFGAILRLAILPQLRLRQLQRSFNQPLPVELDETSVTIPILANDVPEPATIYWQGPSILTKTVVMAKTATESTDWVTSLLPDWYPMIYHMDNTTSALHPPMNKGREAMAYLTYLIDNYHNLSSVMAFIHPHNGGWPNAWHTDEPNHSNAASLDSLRLEHVQKQGYVNLRCMSDPGCPAEIQPFREPHDPSKTAEHAMAQAWTYMFGGGNTTVPVVIAEPCCSQFAVSREQVLRRPRSDYQRYRQWLIETPLDDATSGRLMEYLWHVFFGKEAVYCPDTTQCWCEQFGRC